MFHYHLYVCMGAEQVSCTLMKVEDSSVEFVLFFHLYVGSGNQTLVSRLMQQAPLLTELSQRPLSAILQIRK